MSNIKFVGVFALSAFILTPLAAHATNGYFIDGYGIQSQGIGGIGIALPQDGLAAASNPAGIAFVDNRLDIGLSLFRPDRSAEIVGSGVPGANNSYDGNTTENFLLPELGYIQRISSNLSGSVAVYGNGGMDTNYRRNPYAAYGATGSAGVDLEQLFVTPSLAWKLNEQNAFGIAINAAYQRFKAKGLDGFAPFSSNATDLTDRGADSSTGVGVRLGWTGKIAPTLTLGATWASKIHASDFDKYRGLFADQGSFDIPENYGIGVAWQAIPALTIAGEVQRIKYSDVNSIANPLSNLTVLGQPLGAVDGPGFGWKDVTVAKIGLSYDYSKALTLRVGYDYSQNPIPADQTFFNILAPAVVQNHATLGATWRLGTSSELSFAYTHAFKNTVNGTNSIPAAFGGGNADISLEEDMLGIAYGWKF